LYLNYLLLSITQNVASIVEDFFVLYNFPHHFIYGGIMRNVITVLIITLLIGSIGCKEDKSTPSGPNTTAAPTIPQVTFKGPNTTSTDANAQLAKSNATMMNGVMSQSTYFAAIPAQQNGNTYTWTYGAGGETYTFTGVKQSDGSYVWTLTYTGSASGTPVTNFTLWQGTTSADGKTGNWTFYEPGHAGKTDEFTYTTNASNILTGTWSVYNTGGTTLASKTIIVNNPDGSGSLEVYDDGTFMNYKSVWIANGSGTWYTYDSSGTQIGTGTWT
jgi:hypothetical protein